MLQNIVVINNTVLVQSRNITSNVDESTLFHIRGGFAGVSDRATPLKFRSNTAILSAKEKRFLRSSTVNFKNVQKFGQIQKITANYKTIPVTDRK